jgi:hypothetical protein
MFTLPWRSSEHVLHIVPPPLLLLLDAALLVAGWAGQYEPQVSAQAAHVQS